MLVKDARCLAAALTRMHAARAEPDRQGSSDAVMFWNASRDFLIMLRNSYDEDDEDDDDPDPNLRFEVCIMQPDDEDDALVEALELEHDGEREGDGTCVLQTFSVPAARPEDLEPAREFINRVHAWELCKCGAYFIKDDAPLCLFCQMTDDAGDGPGAPDDACAICHERGLARHMRRQACCGASLHRLCLSKWATKSDDARCPLCRAVA